MHERTPKYGCGWYGVLVWGVLVVLPGCGGDEAEQAAPQPRPRAQKKSTPVKPVQAAGADAAIWPPASATVPGRTSRRCAPRTRRR